MKTKGLLHVKNRRFLAICAGVFSLLFLPACVVYDSYGYGGFVGSGGWNNTYAIGTYCNTLPVGYQTVFWHGSPYYVWGNHFFTRRNGRFQCVSRPSGPLYYRGGRRFVKHVPQRRVSAIQPTQSFRSRQRSSSQSFSRNTRRNNSNIFSSRPSQRQSRSNRSSRSQQRPSARSNPRQPQSQPSVINSATKIQRPSSSAANRNGFTPSRSVERARSAPRPTRNPVSSPRPQVRRTQSRSSQENSRSERRRR